MSAATPEGIGAPSNQPKLAKVISLAHYRGAHGNRDFADTRARIHSMLESAERDLRAGRGDIETVDSIAERLIELRGLSDYFYDLDVPSKRCFLMEGGFAHRIEKATASLRELQRNVGQLAIVIQFPKKKRPKEKIDPAVRIAESRHMFERIRTELAVAIAMKLPASLDAREPFNAIANRAWEAKATLRYIRDTAAKVLRAELDAIAKTAIAHRWDGLR